MAEDNVLSTCALYHLCRNLTSVSTLNLVSAVLSAESYYVLVEHLSYRSEVDERSADDNFTVRLFSYKCLVDFLSESNTILQVEVHFPVTCYNFLSHFLSFFKEIKYSVIVLFVSNPFCPCPEPVGYCESHERHKECEQHYEQTLGRAVVLRFSYGQLFEWSGQVVGLWQCVVTPLAYYRAVLQQNQSGIAAYHCLQRGLVGVAERIFGSRQLAPTLYVLIC